jgi:hypothetical protein
VLNVGRARIQHLFNHDPVQDLRPPEELDYPPGFPITHTVDGRLDGGVRQRGRYSTARHCLRLPVERVAASPAALPVLFQ